MSVNYDSSLRLYFLCPTFLMKPSIHVVSWFRDSLDPSEHTPAWANDPATPTAGPGTPAAASDNAAAAPNLPSPVPHPQVSVECLA